MPLAAGSLVSLSLALVAAAPVEAPRPVEGVVLRYRFAAGEEVGYRVEQEVTNLLAKGQARHKDMSRTHTDQRFEVVGVEADGTATLRMTIARTRMELAVDDEKPTTFDSAEKGVAPAAFEGVRRAVGRPLAEFRVRPDGSVVDFRPLLSSDEVDSIPGKAGLDAKGQVNLFTVFPARPLQPGDEWSDVFTVKVSVTEKLSREVKILRQYRLESVEAGVAAIAVKTSVLTPVSDPQQSVQLIQRTAAGTIRFDVRAGRVVARASAFDNTEIGWAGDDSSYRAFGSSSERLLDPTPRAVSAR